LIIVYLEHRADQHVKIRRWAGRARRAKRADLVKITFAWTMFSK
jgi:hypothetical protein